MRYLTAAQRNDGTGWHYVSMTSSGLAGHPIGACATHQPHATQAEARECFAAHQRANVLLDGTFSNWADCTACGAATKQYAHIRGDGYHLAPLCGEHLTLEQAIKALALDVPAGDSWIS